MRERRGSSFYRSELADVMGQFREGDIVASVITGCDTKFYGVVREISKKENKVYVAWNNGSVSQHDPEEVALVLDVDDEVRERLSRVASVFDGNSSQRRMSGKCDAVMAEDTGRNFSGDPEVHGIDKPRGGGFSIMKRLQDDLREESIEDAGLVEDKDTIKACDCEVSELRSRRAVYHRERGRVYKQTRGENSNGNMVCGRRGCMREMELQPFMKSVKIYVCPECGWKITQDKVI